VDDKIRHRGTAKKQTMVEDVIEVEEDVLHNLEMGLTWSCMWRHTCGTA
jgi:hypothetical protein